MKLLTSPWILMILAMVLHLAGYIGALMTHPFTVPSFKKPEVKVVGIEEILEGKTTDVDWYFKTEELDKFVEELNERRDLLDEREQSLASLQAHIAVEKEELEKLKAEIESRHKALSDQILIIRKNEINNLKSLATSYTNMDPKACIAVFNQMDNLLVIKLLAMMKADRVALLFDEMVKSGSTNPEMIKRVAQLSEQLRLHYKESDTNP
jgi:hypothetical protein